VVRVRGAGGGRVSIAGVACYRPGDRPHLFFKLRICRRRKGEPKGFTWQDYRDLIIAAHRQLAAPLVWVWDNLNVHLAPELASFAAENKAWLRVYRLPAYAPDMNPAEGIWSLLKRSMVNFAAADVAGLVRIIKRKLKKIQYRPHLIDGCLAATGLNIEPLVTPCTTNSTWLTHDEPRLLACPVNERLRHAHPDAEMSIMAAHSRLAVLQLPSRTVAAWPACSA
jgi:transposase